MGRNALDFENKQTHRYAFLSFLKMIDTFEHFNINYFLEGGTLLGIVRDQNLLPWDHDIDFSINPSDLQKILNLRWYFLRRGYKFSVRKSKKDVGPFKKGDIFLIKIKPLFKFLFKEFSPFINSEILVCDLFIKKTDGDFYYWQAKDRVMKVDAKYYETYDKIKFLGRDLRVPAHYKDYLTEKYGDWSVPVKEWDCGVNEKTIIE
ncbi:LicD family protein [Marinilabilia salmonicolor]|uniref:LicD family protein n=1 Tax=Marinilabilia salmonicolor TaxID=989 RepID=UPI00029B28BD|nr:LicD family protein [Marinilabilia salmonicolor]